MADRDMTPVIVTLDRQRPYRVRDEDRDAVWVGPGEAEVPRWVAEHWGLVEPQGITDKEDSIPPDAVSATIETVEEHPLKTIETVEVVDDGSRTVIGNPSAGSSEVKRSQRVPDSGKARPGGS